MALVRVYCGLASTPPTAARSSTNAWLTVAVVDDAGRLLDVSDISDDPSGYAELGALLAERSGASAGLAVAADSDEHQVTLLLAAAGRPLAIADEESLDDYADRFGDDDSADELEAPVSERRAIGLARALQAGALVAATLSAPRELIALKPVLAAHAALAAGRQGAAVALREVLRELYPAALRAYPDPAEPVPLAILDALPEPGLLGAGTVNRGRDATVATELSESGLADEETIGAAITALRVAIAETPRRAGIGKALTAAVAETIRQSVAAVRACDAGIASLVGLLAEKATPVTTPTRAAPRSRTAPPASPLRAIRESSAEVPRVPAPRRGRTQPAPVTVDQVAVDPLRSANGAGPVVPRTTVPRREDSPTPAVAHAAPAPPAHAPVPGPAHSAPAAHIVPEQVNPPLGRQPSAPPVPMSGPPSYGQPAAMPALPRPAEPYQGPSYDFPPAYRAAAGGTIPVPAARPAPEVPAPGSRSDWPLNASGNGAAPAEPARHSTPNPLDPTAFPATALPPTVLERRPSEPAADRRPEPNAPERRPGDALPPERRPTEPNAPERRPGDALPPERRPTVMPAVPRQRDGRVTPPWQADDLPAEPPALRLVEPAPLADRALRDDRPAARERDRDFLGTGERGGPDRGPGGEFNSSGRSGGDRVLGAAAAFSGERRLGAAAAFNRDPLGDAGNAAPLRLVDTEDSRNPQPRGRVQRPAEPISAPPVGEEPDDDLLIFAQARSAWFTGQGEPEEATPSWANPADLGWQAAERVSHPVLGEETSVGLPRRVPQANLVPGSPLPPATESSLRIARDPAAMAAHTTGYFRGSRRGEEVRGFAVGGRPGREAAGGWDFSRDGWEADRGGDRDYEYRSASNR